MIRNALWLAIAGCLMMSGAAKAQSWPEGPGRQLTEETCGACHRTSLITNSSGYDEAGWRHLIGTMIDLSGTDMLNEIAGAQATAIMCSESVFWRCHRRLVSDFLLANGGAVQHIFPTGQTKPHELTAGAKIDKGMVTYPGERTLFDSG